MLYDYWKTVSSTKGRHFPKKIKEKQPFDVGVFVVSCVVGGVFWWLLWGQY